MWILARYSTLKKESRVTFDKNSQKYQTKQTTAVLTLYKILANEPKKEK